MTSPLRVLHVITDRDRRGAQVYATDLAARLEDLGCRGRVVALAPGVSDDSLELDVLGPKRMAAKTLQRLRRAAAGADVVVAHGSTTLAACALGLSRRSPFVYRQISDPVFWAGAWDRRLRTATFLRRAKAVVTLSNQTAMVVAGHYRFEPSRLHVIPNAVPQSAFSPPTPADRQRQRSRFGLPTESFVALYLGALVEEKGADIAVRACSSLADVHLLVVGSGPALPELRAIADDAGRDTVTFAGAIGDASGALHAADVLLLPSRAGDSMPAVLIEAGLCGLPCIATAVGSISDVVVDDRTGIIVEIEDEAALRAAVNLLRAAKDRRTRLGSAARQHCLDNFTIEATAPSWHKLLHDVASR